MADMMKKATSVIMGIIGLVVTAAVIITQNSETLGGGTFGAITYLVVSVIPLMFGVSMLREAMKG
jgi:hypothetical protein